jgi:FecR protein
MGNSFGRLGATLAVVLFVGLACTPARADDQVGVARISVLNGNVTIQRGDSGDSVAAALNAPVMVGDYLSTTGGARTEVQFDNADFVRVGSDSQLRVTHLDSTNHTLQLAAGTIDLRVLSMTGANPQVDTPSISIRPAQAGSYRVTVTHDGDTVFTVRSGRADLLAPAGTQTIQSGASVLVHGAASAPQISSIETVAYDEFDTWNHERDQYVASMTDSPYANSNVVGLDDMQNYGQWVDNSDYGHVWVPYNMGADWSPYHDGRWAWEPGYGWTWVGYEPWGWAPYHYGRWFYAAPYGWAWYPGPAYIAPVWQPALVAFFGFGNGFNVSLAFGNIGWVPLAPFEPYHPWWGRGFAYSPRYINNTTIITNITYNITNITNVTNIYKNCGKPNALGIVARHEFENGTTYHYLPVARGNLKNIALLNGALPVVPTRQNLRFNNLTPSHVALSPQFKNLAQPKQTRTFQDERHALQSMVQHPGTPVKLAPKLSRTPIQSERLGRTSTPAAPVMRTELGASSRAQTGKAPSVGMQGASPWERFATARGDTTRALAPGAARASVEPAVRAVSPSTAGASSPWSRFGADQQTINRARTSHTEPRPQGVSGSQAVTPRSEQSLRSNASTSSPWSRFGGGGQPVVNPARTSHTEPRLQRTSGSQAVTPRSEQTIRSNAPGSSAWGRFGGGGDQSALNRARTSHTEPRWQGASGPSSYAPYQSAGSGRSYSSYRQYAPARQYQASESRYRTYNAPAAPSSRASGHQMPIGRQAPDQKQHNPKQQ